MPINMGKTVLYGYIDMNMGVFLKVGFLIRINKIHLCAYFLKLLMGCEEYGVVVNIEMEVKDRYKKIGLFFMEIWDF